MQVSQTGIDLIKHFEGLELEAYQDVAGIWTIGYGHTGPEVQAGMSISEDEAEALLRQDLERFEAGINSLVKVEIDQNQFDALVSLSYNIGLNAFKNSTALKRLNQGDYLGAAEAITWWNKATVNGVKREVLGLTRRRAAEAALFLQDVGAGEAGGTGEDSTRVAPEENVPRRGNLAGSRTVEGGAVAAGGAAAGAGATMIDEEEDTSDSDVPEEVPADNDQPAEDTSTEDETAAEDPDDTQSDTQEDEAPASDQPSEEPPVDADSPTDASEETTPDAPDTTPPSAEDTTTEVGTPPKDDMTIDRGELKDIIQFIAAAIVILAVIYIIWARIDDWMNYRR